MLRPLYLLYRFLSGLHYRIGRRFTRPGLAVLGAVVLAGLFGTGTEETTAYQAFTLLLALGFVAVCLSFRFRGRFAIQRFLPRFGTVGQPMQYSVVVRNLASKPQADLTLMENLVDPRPGYAEWRDFMLFEEKHSKSFRFRRARGRDPFSQAMVKESRVPTLLSGGEAEVRIELVPSRRGVLRFVGATVARTDPLGLVRSFAKTLAPQTVLILPKRYPLSTAALPGVMKYQEGGVALASNVGRSEEFVSLRDYRYGDPLRKIHWRSWAKAGKPIVKECEDEFFVRHALILDTFTDRPHSEPFEEAVSVAASFACTLLTQESLLDLMFVGSETYCFTAGRGLAHIDQMLEILASVTVCRDRSFRALETAVLSHAGTVSGCVCVFLTWDAERQELARKLRMLGVPLRVLVVVASGANTALDPGPMRDSPEQFHVLEAGKVEQALARLF